MPSINTTSSGKLLIDCHNCKVRFFGIPNVSQQLCPCCHRPNLNPNTVQQETTDLNSELTKEYEFAGRSVIEYDPTTYDGVSGLRDAVGLMSANELHQAVSEFVTILESDLDQEIGEEYRIAIAEAMSKFAAARQ